MAKLTKRATATIANLIESLKQQMEEQIADLTPEQRMRFEAELAKGETRYDALMEVVSSDTERNLLLRPDRFRCQN